MLLLVIDRGAMSQVRDPARIFLELAQCFMRRENLVFAALPDLAKALPMSSSHADHVVGFAPRLAIARPRGHELAAFLERI